MTNTENLVFLENNGAQEILVKNINTNSTYLAGISLAGNSVELYNINIDDGSDDIVISIADFDKNYKFY